ncbi:transcriptional regulator [Ramlibacter henchirensis]|uniref:Transcriptional regulator n=1 Tax=Ramlibacter henchirensis TaxID=204072 RepID=A0A4Z0BNS2_9BURK|nr:ChrR family anti-sigma-E factor [Ramlibacter henchirensis]TFZ00967.1 transcriptional regulator [Ramlibacter henchirensis]
MIVHHPEDEFLLSLAAGRLPAGQAVVVQAHVESCGHCTERLSTLEAVGGALLERAEPHPLSPDLLAATLQRIAGVPPEPASTSPTPATAPAGTWLPTGVTWPTSLRGSKVTPWRWIGPGRRFSRVQLPHDPEATLFLLSISPGRSLPRHRHEQLELTQVLCGAFVDERAVFGPGDFDQAGPDVHHEPMVQPGQVCVCLTWVEGRLRFDGHIATAIARWTGV